MVRKAFFMVLFIVTDYPGVGMGPCRKGQCGTCADRFRHGNQFKK